ncbi:hypothetical protein VQH23_22640 [Pararoseomonas sp. SCSIO 73927]|uniref:hypothetical protein n=1 Tax=Pararoseomonas sp. SCSIO 73927 TaxID=3114537 RepID=UPI0030D1D5C0
MLIRLLRALLLLLLPFAALLALCAFLVALLHAFHNVRLDRPALMLTWLGLVLLPAWIVFGLRERRDSLRRLAFVHLIVWSVLGTYASTVIR